MSPSVIVYTFFVNVAFIIGIYTLARLKGHTAKEDIKDATLALQISFWGLIAIYIAVIVWQLSYFGFIKPFGNTWDPSRDNQYSAEPPAPPPPPAVEPVKDEEATDQTIEEHKNTLKEFELGE